jgi:two-component system, NarL family, sensor histidine kinase DevS
VPRTGSAAEMTLHPAQDRDQIAAGITGIVVSRLFAAGLALEAVAGPIGDHRAAGKVQQAISELDLAVRDLRDMVFDHHRPDLPAAGPPD